MEDAHFDYELFQSNVIHHNLTKIIVPLTAPTLTAALTVYAKQFMADIIYFDSFQEEIESFIEMCRLWDVLRVGGIMVGEEGVDLTKFAQLMNLNVEYMNDNIWRLEKTEQKSCWLYV